MFEEYRLSGSMELPCRKRSNVSNNNNSDFRGSDDEESMDLLDKISFDDKELLRRSWAVLQKNLTDTAYCIFDMIFNQSPDTKQLFPFMRITGTVENKRSREMEFHALRFMQVLESVVKALDNPSSLDPLCDNLGKVHGRLADTRGFKAHHWGVFIECTLFHFRRVLNSDHYFNNHATLDRVIIVWRTVLRILIKRMKVGLAADLRNRHANREIDDKASSSDQSSPVTELKAFTGKEKQRTASGGLTVVEQIKAYEYTI